MAATDLTVQAAPHTGLQLSASTPTQTTGHTAPTGEGIALLVINTSGGVDVFLHTASSATIDGLAAATPSGGTVASRKVSVTAGPPGCLIPVPQFPYGDPTTGKVTFDISATANTTFACVKVT